MRGHVLPPCRWHLARCYSLASRRTDSHSLGPRSPKLPFPKIDLQHIRRNPGLYEENCLNRNYPQLAKNSWKILDLHNKSTQLNNEMRPTREKLNRIDKIIRRFAKKASNSRPRLLVLIGTKRELQKSIDETAELVEEYRRDMEFLAAELPNLTSNDTPIGDTPDIIISSPEPDRKSDQHGLFPGDHSHRHIGEALGIIDLDAARSASGWGFYYLIGLGALLENALVQYALTAAVAAGFKPVNPPSLVYNHTAWACGYQPRDEQGRNQVYVIESDEKTSETPKLALAGTSEIPLAAMYMNRDIDPASLPLKYVGVSRCYRAEAGARGKATAGLYRVHEFTKVELFAWTAPDHIPISEDGSSTDPLPHFSDASPVSESSKILQDMLALQHSILQPLGLPLRTLRQPTTDLGASAACKYDIEAYFPSRHPNPWGELSSLSNCTDYQSRRINARIASSPKQKNMWPYTLNGTAMAVPRVLAALLENGWDSKRGVVRLPECLWPFMGGRKEISRMEECR